MIPLGSEVWRRFVQTTGDRRKQTDRKKERRSHGHLLNTLPHRVLSPGPAQFAYLITIAVFAGQKVSVKEVDDKIWLVSFMAT
jgi:hypothetical protein